MARVNSRNYVESKTVKNVWKDWWLVKKAINLNIVFPEEYVGKRIRIKIEVV